MKNLKMNKRDKAKSVRLGLAAKPSQLHTQYVEDIRAQLAAEDVVPGMSYVTARVANSLARPLVCPCVS